MRPHLAERFGLFVLIAIGESIVAIGGSVDTGGRLDVGIGFAVAAAFALSCGLWWVYFQFAADAVRHALATARVQVDITRLVGRRGTGADAYFSACVVGGPDSARSDPGRAQHDRTPASRHHRLASDAA